MSWNDFGGKHVFFSLLIFIEASIEEILKRG
jgi:hypothetical protein